MDPTGPTTGEIPGTRGLPGDERPRGPFAARVGEEVPPATPGGTAAGEQPTAAAGARTGAAGKDKGHKKRRNLKRLGVEWGIVIAVAVVVAVLLRTFVVQAFFVPSGSMEPTLQVGDRILVIKSSFLSGGIGRGSIIVFQKPANIPCEVEPGVNDLVKRVIGLPGETIQSIGQNIYIDGKQLKEPGWYMPGLQVGDRPIPRTTVPAGDYYVMGDNRNNSCDSRYFGPIASSSIIGKVVMLVWRDGHPDFHFF